MSALPEIAWWFAVGDMLPNGDGRKVVLGETLRVEPPLVLCRRGLHCSADPFDALQYAPGPMLYKVRPSGDFLIGSDKICSTERTALDVRDATAMLRAYARDEALRVTPDAPAIVRRYMEEGDDSIRAATQAAVRAAAAPAWAAGIAAGAAAQDACLAAARQRFNAAVAALFGDAR